MLNFYVKHQFVVNLLSDFFKKSYQLDIHDLNITQRDFEEIVINFTNNTHVKISKKEVLELIHDHLTGEHELELDKNGKLYCLHYTNAEEFELEGDFILQS